MNFSPYTSIIQTTSFDQGQVIVNSLFAERLTDLGYTSFSAIIDLSDGELIKAKKGLEIRKTSFGKGGSHFFIKKHWQSVTGRPSEGRIEFDEYSRFRVDGLATPVPIAFGEKSDGHVLTSFLITQDFSPLIDLEELVLNQPDFFRGKKNRSRRQNVLKAIGKYARKMHHAGCNQKDFNATHILLGDIESKLPKVALFDLQRVDRNSWQQLRWSVKSLGELIFTLPDDQFDSEDHLFLFKSYIGREKLMLFDKLIFRLILAKRDRIARHVKKWKLAPKMGN